MKEIPKRILFSEAEFIPKGVSAFFGTGRAGGPDG